MPVTVGTAGHIDHGKTWLVRALTGKDTDRLPEERERGISIDLGYAPLELPDGRRLSLIDVPGHERFVRNMVAGATGIDLFLLVIDAAEGARPQTHEHLAILSLLGIERGVVAVTKADAVDAETLELAIEEGRELVPGSRGRRGERKDRSGAGRAQRSAREDGRPCVSETQCGKPRAPVRRSRVLAAGNRDGRHRDPVVGIDRRRRRPACGARWARRPRPQRPGARPAGRARRARSAGRGRASRGGAARAAAGRCVARAGGVRNQLPARHRARRARADRRWSASSCPPRHCGGARSRRAGRRRLRAAPARVAGRRGARRSRRPPRRDHRRRRHRDRPRATAPHRPGALRAGGTGRGDGGRTRARRRRLALLGGLARGAAGGAGAGDRRGRRARSGRERTRRALGGRGPGATSVRAQRIQALPPRRGRKPRRACGRGYCRRGRARGGGAGTRQGCGCGAGALPGARGPARAARRRVRRLACCLRTGAGARCRRVRRRRAGHPRALP